MAMRLFIVLMLCSGILSSTLLAQDYCESNLPIVKYMTACVDESGAIDLGETISIDLVDFGGQLAISYPTGWVTDHDATSIGIANNDEGLAIRDPLSIDDIPPGTIIISVTVVPRDVLATIGLSDDSTARDVLTFFAGFVTVDDMPTFGDIEDITINDQSSARMTGAGDAMAVAMYTVDKSNSVIFAFSATRADEIGEHRATIEAVIGSAQFTVTE